MISYKLSPMRGKYVRKLYRYSSYYLCVLQRWCSISTSRNIDATSATVRTPLKAIWRGIWPGVASWIPRSGSRRGERWIVSSRGTTFAPSVPKGTRTRGRWTRICGQFAAENRNFIAHIAAWEANIRQTFTPTSGVDTRGKICS